MRSGTITRAIMPRCQPSWRHCQACQIKKAYAEIIEKGQCVSLKELAVTGRDLIRAGMKPGKEIGEKLNELLNLVIENPEMNTRETLLNYISTDKEV